MSSAKKAKKVKTDLKDRFADTTTEQKEEILKGKNADNTKLQGAMSNCYMIFCLLKMDIALRKSQMMTCQLF